jgi:drug/metabolite transporter (DMT)-like permease
LSRRPLISTAPGTRTEAYAPLDWALLGAIALMWGSSFLWIAEGLEVFSPFVVTSGRLLFGAVALGMFPAARARVPREDLPAVAVLALVWITVPLLLFPLAQQWVDSSIAGSINGSTPLHAAVIGALLLRRIPGPRQAIGLFVGFGGVLLVTLPGATEAGGSPLGIGLLVLASFLYGIGLNLLVPLAQRHGSLPVLWRVQLIAFGVTLPFGIGGVSGSGWAWSSAAAVLVLGVLSTGVAFVAMGVLSARVGATRAAVAIYFLPVVAMALGVSLRGEHVPWPAAFGTALVILGAWLATRREH